MAKRSTAPMLLLVLGVFFALFGAAKGRHGKPPNILLILLDDLGYHDLGVMGSDEVDSPNIDRLAKGGVSFPNAYSTGTFCSPARAALLSGIDPARYGHIFNPPHSIEDTKIGLPPKLTIMPQTMKNGGYATSLIGKWHLGFAPEYHPMKRGFDRFFGFLGGYFPYWRSEFTNGVYKLKEFIYDHFQIATSVKYLTIEFTNRAIEYITDAHHAGKPFYMYLSFNAPHGPFQFLEKDVDPAVPNDRKPHVAMIKRLDIEIGNLISHLESLGILKDTVIFLTNDNGGHRKGAINYPLNDYKGSWFEGGIRVPLFIYWKDHIKAGQVVTDTITILDLYPTIQDVANIPEEGRNKDLEGVSLMPHICMAGSTGPENPNPPHEHICMGSLLQGVVRRGNWKLHVDRRNKEVQTQLFDLSKDVGETNDLSFAHAETAKSLLQLHNRWKHYNAGSAVFPSSLVSLPIRMGIVEPESTTVSIRNSIEIKAWATHAKNKRMTFHWEYYNPRFSTMADFNMLQVKTVNVTYNWNKSKATFTFPRKGRWAVRFNAKDDRFLVFKELVLHVKR